MFISDVITAILGELLLHQNSRYLLPLVQGTYFILYKRKESQGRCTTSKTKSLSEPAAQQARVYRACWIQSYDTTYAEPSGSSVTKGGGYEGSKGSSLISKKSDLLAYFLFRAIPFKVQPLVRSSLCFGGGEYLELPNNYWKGAPSQAIIITASYSRTFASSCTLGERSLCSPAAQQAGGPLQFAAVV